MTFIQRLGFYMGGFALGLILLAFFLSGKKTSCAYGPEARVKKNIRFKPIHFSEEVEQLIESGRFDTVQMNRILKNGKVLFSESDTTLDSCKIYVLVSEAENEAVKLVFQNCDSIAHLRKVTFERP